ncbi:MAG: YfcC family protein [Firmicutes bacterium]|nr:YfcC family protein [Bacillota bacterium]
MKEKKKFKLLHPYALIVILIVICTIATWIVPAGQYDQYVNDAGTTVVDPDSFHYVEKSPVGPFKMVQAIPTGMSEVGWIIFLVFIIGGAFGIINKTGAIEAGIGHSISKVKGKDAILIIFLMAIFSLGGATFAMAESTLLFIPICVMLSKALGYDNVVGMAIINIGAVCGFAAGWMNVFTVGVAQGIAELDLFSGMGYRIICHVVILTISIIYVLMYAKKIRKDPTKSAIYGEEDHSNIEINMDAIPEFTGRRKAVLLVALAGFIVLVYGITHGWSTGTQISSLFLVMGVVCGYVGGLKTDEICDAFVEGAKGIAFGALLVGLCRAMVVILTNGMIIHTILHALAGILNGLPATIAAGLMVVVQSLVNFLINSGSGQAATTMPIMAPLADLLGLERQVAVLAYQFGDGLSNSLWPTSGILMAGLTMAGISYGKWFKWVWKLMVILHIVVIILCMIAVSIGYK